MTELEAEHVELLRRAVATPSLSGEEGELAAFLVGWMRERGMRARLDGAGNAVGEAGSGPLTVALLGHMDTVPGEVPVRLEEGWLWGRGSVDAKGPLCAFLAAVSSLPPEVLERARFVCVGAVEEEAPSSRGARFVLNHLAPDLCVVGEPSGWDAVTLGYKGRLVAQARLEKANFHSAGEGTTAAEDVVAYWNALSAWADGFNEGARLFDSVQLSLQEVSSGGDGLRQTCSAVFGLRLPPRLGPAAAAVELEGRRPPGLELRLRGHEEAHRGEKDTPLTRAFRLAIREAGGQPGLKLKTGTSDMNVVAPVWGCPILAYGPGDSGLDHRPDERIELAEYLRAILVLRSALGRLAARVG